MTEIEWLKMEIKRYEKERIVDNNYIIELRNIIKNKLK